MNHNTKCANCHKGIRRRPSELKNSITGNHFCSRTCSASYNNKAFPKKRKNTTTTITPKICNKCQSVFFTPRKSLCHKCSSGLNKDRLLSNVIYDRHHKSSAYAFVRTRARAIAKKLGWKSCRNCEYDKHIEICHIKPISDFPYDSMLSDINNKSNLIPLCPNCHWEFDNNLFQIENMK